MVMNAASFFHESLLVNQTFIAVAAIRLYVCDLRSLVSPLKP